MRGYRTTFIELFGEELGGKHPIDKVEIPLIQRDFAQGRKSLEVDRIRRDFLQELSSAVRGNKNLELDFIYGIQEGDRFAPLDGQQRLTTLFLLHWMVATRRGALGGSQPWTNFSYATRPSARIFSERIIANPAPKDTQGLDAWIQDQPWHLHTWRFDPTVRSMLVMIRSLEAALEECDWEDAWQRLANRDAPAVSFYVMPLQDDISGDDLYIKMNSRGKPLTDFENFKARFEKALGNSPLSRRAATSATSFERKIDGDWTETLWKYRGEDDVIDDEFLRYMIFILEVCEWRNSTPTVESLTLEDRAERILLTDPSAAENLAFMFSAFDTWTGVDVKAYFSSRFTTAPESDRIRLFGHGAKLDLFESCCRSYGEFNSRNREFSLADSMLLFAVILQRLHPTEPDIEFRRMRQLRNLLILAENEIRVDKMPRLVKQVEALIINGSFDGESVLPKFRIDDEISKAEFLESASAEEARALVRLENNDILRGCLFSFELDESLPVRAAKFEQVLVPRHYVDLKGALQSAGPYQRNPKGSTIDHFGPSTREYESEWREVFCRDGRAPRVQTRRALELVLDGLTGSELEISDQLREQSTDFVARCEVAGIRDDAYYYVKYPLMRTGDSGRYAREEGHSFEAVMLRRRHLNSKYWDPYIRSSLDLSEMPTDNIDQWFSGYEYRPRWLELIDGTRVRAREGGLIVEPGTESRAADAINALLTPLDRWHGGDVEHDGIAPMGVAVPQVERDGMLFDSTDRVVLFAEFFTDVHRALVSANY